jgi:hypothetical protein
LDFNSILPPKNFEPQGIFTTGCQLFTKEKAGQYLPNDGCQTDRESCRMFHARCGKIRVELYTKKIQLLISAKKYFLRTVVRQAKVMK